MTFPHVLRRDNTWGTPPKVHKSTKMTHTMILGPITSWSKSLLGYKTRLMVMDVAAADKTSLMKEKKHGPSVEIM